MKYKDIIDKKVIRELIDPNNHLPDGFLPKELQQIGTATRTRNDNLPDGWSTDKYFSVAHTYPIYIYEGVEFAVGEDKKGHKLDARACWKIKRFYKKD